MNRFDVLVVVLAIALALFVVWALSSCCQIGNYVATNLNPVGNLYSPAPCWPKK